MSNDTYTVEEAAKVVANMHPGCGHHDRLDPLKFLETVKALAEKNSHIAALVAHMQLAQNWTIRLIDRMPNLSPEGMIDSEMRSDLQREIVVLASRTRALDKLTFDFIEKTRAKALKEALWFVEKGESLEEECLYIQGDAQIGVFPTSELPSDLVRYLKMALKTDAQEEESSQVTERTSRGFAVYVKFTDDRKNEVRLQRSSEMGEPRAWLFTRGPDDKETYEHLGQQHAYSPYLNKEQARALAKALLQFAEGDE